MNKWRNWRTGPKYVREDLDAELFGALDDCLFLVGNSDQNKYLRKMIKDLNLSSSVILTGIIPHNDILNYLHTMNIAIVPYGCNHNIYFSPIKFFEYMGAGKPTVATSLGQVKEIIEHEKTGWFYEASNQESLIEAMETLLYSSEISEK